MGRGLSHSLTRGHLSGSHHGSGHSYDTHTYGHLYGITYGRSDLHYPHHVGYGSYYPSYGGLGYYYPSYSSTTYIYTPVYVDPDYVILDDSEFDDEAENGTLDSQPADEAFDDSIDAEAEPDAERTVAGDITLQRLLIELDELPEDSFAQPEADSDESSDG